ncbi:hypothetical protein QZH41_017198 [Actinostola sp. cb2023]|nr:hypothetical protein QZH41_017198 [Actinostola sp. cb2023]
MMNHQQTDQEVTQLLSKWVSEASEPTFTCPECSKPFKHQRNLTRHQREVHQNQSVFTCPNCMTTFKRKHDFQRHERECTGLKRRLEESEYNAPPEKKQKLTDEELIEYELSNIPDAMSKEYSGPLLGDDVLQEVLLGDDVRQEVLQDDDVRQEGGGEVEEDCALDGNVSLLKFQPNKREKFDLQLTLEGKKKNIIKQLKTQRQKHRGIKWFLCVKVRMIKTSPDGDVESTPHFRSMCFTTVNETGLIDNDWEDYELGCQCVESDCQCNQQAFLDLHELEHSLTERSTTTGSDTKGSYVTRVPYHLDKGRNPPPPPPPFGPMNEYILQVNLTEDHNPFEFEGYNFNTTSNTKHPIIISIYNQAVEKVKTTFLEYQREGSGWQLDKVLHLDLGVVAYKPVEGASYLPLSKKIKNKKAVLNVQNDDPKCFLWSVLAAKHPIHWRDQPHRVNHYKPYESELNMAGIDYPVKIDQVKKFERQNPTTSVNVFGLEEQELFPLYVTKDKKELHVNLLLYSQDTRRHYCLIRDLDRLLSSITRHDGRMYHCNYCMHGFVRQDLLDDHEPHCGRHEPQKIKLPDEDHTTLQYTEVQKQLKVPFVIYADFESILIEHDKSELDRNMSFTQKTQHHQPCGFCYTIVSTVEDYCKPPVVYRGEDAVDTFLENLIEEEKQITEILKVVVPMEITNEQEQAFQEATVCHICRFDLGADRVRDHDHLTGLYRGVVHNECNLNYKFTGNIPVVLHNLRGYDSHLIMQGLGKMTSEKISCIPNNTEKYISFSVGNLVFNRLLAVHERVS